MKKRITLAVLSAFVLNFGVFSQKTSTLEVFSENGEKFSLVINGVAQNDAPAANVKAEGLTGDFHRISVSFEDASLGSVSQNFALDPGMYQRASVVLKRNGKYAVRPFGEPVALTEAPARPERRAEMHHDVEVVEVTAPDAEVTTTTTTTTKSGSGESVRMDIGVGGQRVGVNVEINDPTAEATHTTTVTETTETRVTKAARVAEPAPAEEKAEVCAPMASGAFAGAKRSVSSKSFADEKKTTARQILRSNCMSTDQIIEMMGLFSFEDDKLEFAKSAYDRCSDPENYWKLNDAFTFSDSIQELDEFLQSK